MPHWKAAPPGENHGSNSNRRAAANLASEDWCGAAAAAGISAFASAGGYARLVPLLWCDDYETVVYALVALQNVCRRIECSRLIVAQGARGRLDDLAASGDAELEKYAAGVLANMREATIVHGATGHTCCCFPCAKTLQQHGNGCPICRAPIEMVIRAFKSAI